MFRGMRVPASVSLTSLGWLYLVQGIPYGLQDKFIPVHLRARGLQYSSVSLLKSLLLPWVAKGLWAPFVEVLGGRHCWLLLSLLALSASSYAGSQVGLDDMFGIGCMLLALNVFSAVQDVAADGLALELLPEEQLGLGNTIQVVLYKVGCLVGGAGLTYLLELTDWNTAFNGLAFLYLFTAAWSLNLPTNSNIFAGITELQEGDEMMTLGPETDEVIDVAEKERGENGPNQEKKSVLMIFREVINTPGTAWVSLYVLLYKMGERGAVNNMPLHLLDKGMTKHHLAFWNGTVCQVFSILGSFYGGLILAKRNADVKALLILHSMYRLLAVLVQFVLISLWNERYAPIYFTSGIVSMCSLSFTSGVISTASFTLMMKVSRACSGESQASHYSALASVEIAGKLIFATLAGFIIEYVGVMLAFLTFTALCGLPCLVLVAMPNGLSHLKAD